MVILLWLTLSFFLVKPGFCDEVSLIEHKLVEIKNPPKSIPKKMKNVSSPGAVSALKEMDDFIVQENERMKVIKLLNLDLEKASLQLKQKEILVKLAQLNMPSPGITDPNLPDEKMNIKIISTMVSQHLKEAMLSINGIIYTVHEGDVLSLGLTVKSISMKKILVVNAGGKEETIIFNG